MTLKNDNQPWYREPWPWILMAGPGIVIIGAVITIWLAVVSNDGLVTDDYYKQGMTVNQKLQRDHHAASLGLSADLMRSGNGIRLLINSSAGGDLPELLNIRLAHPTQSGFDQVVKMKLVGQGFYEGNLLADINGRWHVSIEDPAGKWRLQGDWRVDSEEPLRVTAKAG